MQYLGFVVKLKETTASDRFGFVTQQDGLWEVMTSKSTENIFFLHIFHSSGVPRGRGLGGSNPPRNSEGPPKSCQTQPDCENC